MTVVEVTEWVRFHDDGSSTHIRVIDGELLDSFEMDPSPYLYLRDWPPVPPRDAGCSWVIEIKRVAESEIRK